MSARPVSAQSAVWFSLQSHMNSAWARLVCVAALAAIGGAIGYAIGGRIAAMGGAGGGFIVGCVVLVIIKAGGGHHEHLSESPDLSHSAAESHTHSNAAMISPKDSAKYESRTKSALFDSGTRSGIHSVRASRSSRSGCDL